MIQELRKNNAITDAATQTRVGGNIVFQRPPSPTGGLPFIPRVNASESHDDVNDLLVETYVSRPPRLIYGTKVKQNQPLIDMEQS